MTIMNNCKYQHQEMNSSALGSQTHSANNTMTLGNNHQLNMTSSNGVKRGSGSAAQQQHFEFNIKNIQRGNATIQYDENHGVNSK